MLGIILLTIYFAHSVIFSWVSSWCPSGKPCPSGSGLKYTRQSGSKWPLHLKCCLSLRKHSCWCFIFRLSSGGMSSDCVCFSFPLVHGITALLVMCCNWKRSVPSWSSVLTLLTIFFNSIATGVCVWSWFSLSCKRPHYPTPALRWVLSPCQSCQQTYCISY